MKEILSLGIQGCGGSLLPWNLHSGVREAIDETGGQSNGMIDV